MSACDVLESLFVYPYIEERNWQHYYLEIV